MKLVKENIPFTMVANEVLCNKNLSFKAKGLYTYLFSKPDTWDFSGDRIVLETVDRRKSIFSALKELEDAGYLCRNKLPTGKMEYGLKHSSKSLMPKMGNRVIEPVDQKGNLPKRLIAEKGSISNKEEKVINNKKVISNSKTPVLQQQQIGILLKEFEILNPVSSLYANTTERLALETMAQKIGYDKLLATIKALPQIVNKPFAPKITKPTELRRDFGKLLLFVKQNENRVEKYQAKSIEIK